MNKTPRVLIFVVLTAFVLNSLGYMPGAWAQMLSGEDFRLPAPGVMVRLSPPLDPPLLKGLRVHEQEPFRFDFIVDKGDIESTNEGLRDESSRLIKYFLTGLTIPEKDLWVNLSPYEKERIIPSSFGLTAMGRDLLAEDYMLKQITASLIYPEGEIGKKFWDRIYAQAQKKYGTTNIPVNTFNKVWIVPEKAVVYENPQAQTAYIVEARLKVMLEEDYLSLQKHNNKSTSPLGSQILREIVLPQLTEEVNNNKNFSKLRQVYYSLILATWYKNKIKDSILNQVYANRNKTDGISIADPQEEQKIYQRYLRAFKKGVYNYIKEERDALSQELIPRKYFSGGVDLNLTNLAMTAGGTLQLVHNMDAAMEANKERLVQVNSGVAIAGAKTSQDLTWEDLEKEGYSFEITHQGKSFDGDIIEGRVKQHGRVLMRPDHISDIEMKIYPSVKAIVVFVFEPAFPTPATSTPNKYGAGRALLRHLLKPYEGYHVLFSYANTDLQHSFMQMSDYQAQVTMSDYPLIDRGPFKKMMRGILSKLSKMPNVPQQVLIQVQRTSAYGIVPSQDNPDKAMFSQHINDFTKGIYQLKGVPLFVVADDPEVGAAEELSLAKNLTGRTSKVEILKQWEIMKSKGEIIDITQENLERVISGERPPGVLAYVTNAGVKLAPQKVIIAKKKIMPLLPTAALEALRGKGILKEDDLHYIFQQDFDKVKQEIADIIKDQNKLKKIRDIWEKAYEKAVQYITGKMVEMIGLSEGSYSATMEDLEKDQHNSLKGIDGLTRLQRGQEFAEEAAVNLLKRRGVSQRGFAMGDIDHFGGFNDIFGHVGGDDVLTKAAQGMVHSIRNGEGDRVVRYGGEEFMFFIALTNTPGYTIDEFSQEKGYTVKAFAEALAQVVGITLPPGWQNRSEKVILEYINDEVLTDRNLYNKFREIIKLNEREELFIRNMGHMDDNSVMIFYRSLIEQVLEASPKKPTVTQIEKSLENRILTNIGKSCESIPLLSNKNKIIENLKKAAQGIEDQKKGKVYDALMFQLALQNPGKRLDGLSNLGEAIKAAEGKIPGYTFERWIITMSIGWYWTNDFEVTADQRKRGDIDDILKKHWPRVKKMADDLLNEAKRAGRARGIANRNGSLDELKEDLSKDRAMATEANIASVNKTMGGDLKVELIKKDSAMLVTNKLRLIRTYLSQFSDGSPVPVFVTSNVDRKKGVVHLDLLSVAKVMQLRDSLEARIIEGKIHLFWKPNRRSVWALEEKEIVDQRSSLPPGKFTFISFKNPVELRVDDKTSYVISVKNGKWQLRYIRRLKGREWDRDAGEFSIGKDHDLSLVFKVHIEPRDEQGNYRMYILNQSAGTMDLMWEATPGAVYVSGVFLEKDLNKVFGNVDGKGLGVLISGTGPAVHGVYNVVKANINLNPYGWRKARDSQSEEGILEFLMGAIRDAKKSLKHYIQFNPGSVHSKINFNLAAVWQDSKGKQFLTVVYEGKDLLYLLAIDGQLEKHVHAAEKLGYITIPVGEGDTLIMTSGIAPLSRVKDQPPFGIAQDILATGNNNRNGLSPGVAVLAIQAPVKAPLVDRVAEEVYRLITTAPSANIDPQFQLDERDEKNIVKWIQSQDLLPEGTLFKKLVYNVTTQYRLGQKTFFEDWLKVLSQKWGIPQEKIFQLMEWIRKNSILIQDVPARSLEEFFTVFIESNKSYPNLMKNFVYNCPPDASPQEKLDLAASNSRRMMQISSPDFIRGRVVLKAPIEGTEYFIGFKYGIAEGTHSLYLVLGKQGAGRGPLDGTFFRIGLDTQGDGLRVMMMAGVRRLSEEINRYFPEEFGFHPGLALLYVASQLAAQGHLRYNQDGFEKDKKPFERIIGVKLAYISTYRKGSLADRVNPNKAYEQLGLKDRGSPFIYKDEVSNVMERVANRIKNGSSASKGIEAVIEAFHHLKPVSNDDFEPEGEEALGAMDQAMESATSTLENTKKGGIDLTLANMNLQTKVESLTNTGIKFHLDPTMLQQLRNAPGFVPVVINILPVRDLRAFLGMNQEQGVYKHKTL